MCAPVVSRIALILHPPRPITRLITDDETAIFLDLLMTSFHPSSCRFPFFGLGKEEIFVVADVVVSVTARHWAAAVATVMGESALWGVVVWVMMVLATSFVKAAVFMTLMTSLDLTEDVVVTAAVMAILVSVSRDPVDDFLVLAPLTLLFSITVGVLRGGCTATESTPFSDIFLSCSPLSSLFSFSATFFSLVSTTFSPCIFFFFFCFFLSLLLAASAFFIFSCSLSKSSSSSRIHAFLLASAAWRSLAVTSISIFLWHLFNSSLSEIVDINLVHSESDGN